MIPTVLGVYETRRIDTLGSGVTRQTHELRILWFAAQVPGGEISCQPLNEDNLPSGFVQKIDKNQFLADYVLVPDVYEEHLRSVVNSLRDKVNGARAAKEVPSLSREEGMLLRGLMAFMHARPDVPLTDTDLFSVKSMLDAMRHTGNVILEYQRVLTGAAIDLRKQRKFDEAEAYYSKALELDGHNDHILFNLARVYFEKGQVEKARDMLLRALEINPDLEMARRFLRFLDASGKG
ncbi:tetratricopeptide repeat protein [Desulfovibrio mangrovi]|uniref:tetratricopeptide repeat protein n=1 Tax=Desulfovibrio mangrovi TaxID=2976983 RepID=UPI00224758AD|nr:tetratricopeptide repeat protein [Desulfovibrio mangrovi]UZP65886.1 tetratricopeptide repeat protein [Desulfovibrio mangrovi]